MMTSGGFSELLAPGLFEVMFNMLERTPPSWMPILNVKNSTRAYEEDLKMAGLGSMTTKPEGVAVDMDDFIMGDSVRYTHASYGLGCRVTREMYDDDLYDIMNQIAEELSAAATYKIEVDAWSVFNNAFSASFLGSDAKALCATDHPRLDGGANIANKPTTDVDFSYSAYQGALDHFKVLVDDRGRPLDMSPALLLIDPSFEWQAKEIMESEFKPYTDNNEINPVKSGSMSYMKVRYFTDGDAWFVIAPKRSKVSKRGHDLKWWWRVKPEPSSADDFLTGDSLFKQYARYAKGFSEFRGVYGSSGGA